MTVDQAVELGRGAILLTLLIGAPIMIVSAFVGLTISLFQAVTQLQDQTISFVPKIVAMILMILYLLPWIIGQMTEYSTQLINDIPSRF